MFASYQHDDNNDTITLHDVPSIKSSGRNQPVNETTGCVLPDHSRGHAVHPDVIYSSLGGESFGQSQQGRLTDRVRS